MVATKRPYRAFERPFKYAKSPERGITYWDWILEPITGNDGEVEFLVLTLHNVTERKRIEKEMRRLERLNLIGQMAGGIGHEIRNPITTVKGFLQLLSQEGKSSKEKSYFDIMISELNRANTIITDYLSLFKEAKVMHFDNLNLLIEKMSPLLEAQVLKLGRDLVVELAEIPDFVLNGIEIRQLILNLVQNGFEASPPGGVVTILTYVDKGYAVLVVRDQGKGIEPGVLQRLGTPFLTTKESGTGLDLYICYSIVENHNGRIEIDTGVNGTSFYIYLQLSGMEIDSTLPAKEIKGMFCDKVPRKDVI